MRNINLTFFFFSIVFCYCSCKKNTVPVLPLASVRVVNAVVDGKAVKLNSNLRDSALVFNSRVFSVPTGTTPLRIYPSGDSTNPYLNTGKESAAGDIYSLYFFGKFPASVESVWVKEDFEPYYTDSAFAVRFINLCTDSEPLSFTLASDPSNPLFSNIAVKGTTPFVKLPLKIPVPAGSMTFQARTADKTVVAFYTLPSNAVSAYSNVSVLLSRYKRITIVVKGIKGMTSGGGAVGMFPVANY